MDILFRQCLKRNSFHPIIEIEKLLPRSTLESVLLIILIAVSLEIHKNITFSYS